MQMKEDGLDQYRKEYNQMLLDKAMGANGIMQEKYLTVSVARKDVDEARTYFSRIGADLSAHFAALGSKCMELTAAERLRMLHDFTVPVRKRRLTSTLRAWRERGMIFGTLSALTLLKKTRII